MLPLTNMFQIQCLNSKTESKTNILAKFCIEPLKKGQGIITVLKDGKISSVIKEKNK